MKKVLYLLMALPLFFASCDDDDNDFPRVKIGIDVSGCQVVDGVIYVVQGDTISVDSLNVVAVDGKTKVAIAAVNYYWDRMYVDTNVIPPFQFSIDTGKAMIGRHLLHMRCSLLAVDYPPVIAHLDYPVRIVASPQDIPNGNVSGPLFIVPEIDD